MINKMKNINERKDTLHSGFITQLLNGAKI